MKFNNKYELGKNVIIGNNVKIGDGTVIYDNVEIEDDTVISNNCIIGEPLNSYYFEPDYVQPKTTISKGSLIRSHCIFYAGSTFGENFQSGHRVTIRENTTFGANCSVGTLSDIQGESEFGDFCRLHSNVHIGMKSKLGNYVFVYPYVVFTNDPTPPSDICIGPLVEDYAQIATMSVLLPGVKIGKHALVGAGSIISKDVEEYSLSVGNPGRHIKDVRDIKSRKTQESHYPWPNRFSRGMPWEKKGYELWSQEK
jgi:acetyltransferase-like isoleucine patch superfamily enzyme